ncbi:hypothetical protein ABZP36_026616 [Zizania latifolia]
MGQIYSPASAAASPGSLSPAPALRVPPDAASTTSTTSPTTSGAGSSPSSPSSSIPLFLTDHDDPRIGADLVFTPLLERCSGRDPICATLTRIIGCGELQKCTSLERLYVAFCSLPRAAAAGGGDVVLFPRLRELGLTTD